MKHGVCMQYIFVTEQSVYIKKHDIRGCQLVYQFNKFETSNNYNHKD